jgi:serine/threonine-protein kinase
MNTIGRYELVEKLGQGGMGVVYRAFDPLLQRVVAVKLIGSIEANDELRERFFREARAAGQLTHKNIITIYDLGEFEGQPFLAMEFLEGQDLQQRMAAHIEMSLMRKLELAIEICEGLDYAHSHGVIHRDVKPANIFITTSGTAKILDFGLARLITSELTNSNMMMGTLNYMAPEQVRGERADHRSDIFSTGVLLYEVLGGRKAFEGDSFGATLYKILQEVPEPLRNIDATLPVQLIAVVERALEKGRDDRYQQMGEMLRDLNAYRQLLMVTNSPAFGQPILPSDAATIAAMPATPLPVLASSGVGRPQTPATAAPAPVTPEVERPSRRHAVLGIAVAATAIVVALAVWMNRGEPAAPPPAATTATSNTSAAATQQEIASRLEEASKALQAGDEATAQKHADAVLAISPGNAEAQRLRDRARQTSETVARSLTRARDLFAAGRFEDASRAAGEVLAVEPANAEARRLMDDSAARSRGKGADEARTRAARAKGAATAAAAPTLAAGAYGAAISAEREAAGLYKRGQLAEAMAKYWEASGLFRSAEVAAQTEAAARAARARTVPAPERRPADPLPPVPATPISPTTGLPLPTVTPPAPPPPVQQPAPTPAAQPQPAPAEPAAPAALPPSGVIDVLNRYKAALENRNLEALKRLWPGLGGAQESAIRYEFQNATRIDVDIMSPQIAINGTNATVTFTRGYQLHTKDGQRLRTETRTTMSLQRSGNAWVIEHIRFEGK